MTLDIRQPDFWKRDAVDSELRRVYDICSGCRRCLPLCPSFKVLFDRLDADPVDGDVEKLPAKDVKEVVDLCYQCKLCYNHCPYTPPHRWQVDFPRLMLRSRSAEARAKGVTLQDRFLGNTELVGRLGSMTAPLSNWVSSLPPQRALMQAVLGIHKDRQLPAFHRETFSAWFDRRRRDIVVPGPTCSYMLKQEYPWLDGSEDADLVASHTRDLFEYLAGLHATRRAGSTRASRMRRPRSPISCPAISRHRTWAPKSADLLRLTGAAVETIERCSAVDGTWGMKKEYFELSMKLAEPLFKDVRETGRPAWPRTARSPLSRSGRARAWRPATRSGSLPRPTGSKRSRLHDPGKDRGEGRFELLRV